MLEKSSGVGTQEQVDTLVLQASGDPQGNGWVKSRWPAALEEDATVDGEPAPKQDPREHGVAVLTVATNRYLDYWKKMAASADRFLAPGSPLTFYVFTDHPKEAQQIESQLQRSRVITKSIPNLGWPDATLFRYEIFRASWYLVNEEIVMHLDADMKLVSPTPLYPGPERWPNGIAFVRHPGYRRPHLGARLHLYSRSPRMVKGDVEMWLRHGALGAWEESQESLAYVPRNRRRVYVCGGTWMGTRESLGNMVHLLTERTREDFARGVVAQWHDESHLNWFASTHRHYLFDSQKCFAVGYLNLADIEAQIVAVDKGTNRTR